MFSFRFFTSLESQNKQYTYSLKSNKNLDTYLSILSSEDYTNAAWTEVYKDLALEEVYNEDTEGSNAIISAIFSRNRPYLLSRLLHQSKLSTLRCYIQYLLSSHESWVQIDPSAVLDFLTNCINLPKLLSGNLDNAKMFSKSKDIFKLDSGQIRKLIEYVLLEGDVSKRTDLVLRSCCCDKSKISFVVSLLKQHAEDRTDFGKTASELHTRFELLQVRIINLIVLICFQIVFALSKRQSTMYTTRV